MKQRSATQNRLAALVAPYLDIRMLGRWAAVFAAGLLMSRAGMFDRIAPFGVAFAAGVPVSLLLPALIGAAVGYCLPMLPVAGATKYLVALCVVAVIRLLLNNRVKFAKKGGFSAAVALLATGVPSLLSAYALLADVAGFTVSAAETVLSAAVAFFCSVALQSLEQGFLASVVDRKQHACLVVMASILLLALCGVQIAGCSVGRFAAVLVILVIASAYGPAAACAAGVVVGVTSGLASFNLIVLAAVYGFAALLAGVFGVFGRTGSAAAFILANGMAVLMAGTDAVPLSVLYEVMAATLVYMLLPQKLLNRAALFKLESLKPQAEANAEIYTRLALAGNAMREVRAAVETVSQGLSRIQAGDISSVYDEVSHSVCSHCDKRLSCWGKHYNRTMGAFNALSEAYKQQNTIEEDDFPPEFLESCKKTRRIITAVNDGFNRFRTKESSVRRFGEVRSIVSEQFEAMSELLDELSSEAMNHHEVNAALSAAVREYLEGTGITPTGVLCENDKDGRLLLTIRIATDEIESISRVKLAKALGVVCKKSLALPVITEKDNLTTIRLREKPRLTVLYGEYQSAFKDGRVCGDNIRYIANAGGQVQVVLSDGMGSGPAAAVDSAMTSSLLTKMISAGLRPEGAMKFANSALLVKSAEESLSTADITLIDLYTGKTQIYKAGAAPTFVKNEGKAFMLEGDSLPIGILNGVSIDQNQLRLDNGDIVLMVSDGALTDGPEWIIQELERYDSDDMGSFAKYIVETAKKRRSDGHDDDISAAAMLVTANA